MHSMGLNARCWECSGLNIYISFFFKKLAGLVGTPHKILNQQVHWRTHVQHGSQCRHSETHGITHCMSGGWRIEGPMRSMGFNACLYILKFHGGSMGVLNAAHWLPRRPSALWLAEKGAPFSHGARKVKMGAAVSNLTPFRPAFRPGMGMQAPWHFVQILEFKI